MLLQILASPQLPPALVVMGRSGDCRRSRWNRATCHSPASSTGRSVHYPGIELVVDTDLSADSDPYLADHLLDGDLLFPAVLGMEAMAQAATALAGAPGRPVFETSSSCARSWCRPTARRRSGSPRCAAADAVDVAIRSSDTGFQADHFRATLRYGGRSVACRRTCSADRIQRAACRAGPGHGPVRRHLLPGAALPAGDRLPAAVRHVVRGGHLGPARAAAGSPRYLPAELLLGDPGARDAFMHAIQCCVPDATLLPAGSSGCTWPTRPEAAGGSSPCTRSSASATATPIPTTWTSVTARGSLVERWEGLRLHAVRKTTAPGRGFPRCSAPTWNGRQRRSCSVRSGAPSSQTR